MTCRSGQRAPKSCADPDLAQNYTRLLWIAIAKPFVGIELLSARWRVRPEPGGAQTSLTRGVDSLTAGSRIDLGGEAIQPHGRTQWPVARPLAHPRISSVRRFAVIQKREFPPKYSTEVTHADDGSAHFLFDGSV